MDIKRSDFVFLINETFQALMNWMREVITERNLEAEWEESEAEEQWPSSSASGYNLFPFGVSL